jgi:lactate dehydrogenase-like 2-hydroxyacid dehydrogenase
MTVRFAERKGVLPTSVRDGKVAFETVLKTSTVLFLTLPLSQSTANTLTTYEMSLLNPELTPILVNVSRGGIVEEEALIQALEDKVLAGCATDVFLEEPAGKENSLLVRKASEWENGMGEMSEMSGRLILSPHVAWWARSSLERLRGVVARNIEAWCSGRMDEVYFAD